VQVPSDRGIWVGLGIHPDLASRDQPRGGGFVTPAKNNLIWFESINLL
jgi:hypothetical protein